MAGIKHYRKPSHKILDKEDKALLDKKGLLKENKQFRSTESSMGRILRLKKKHKKGKKR